MDAIVTAGGIPQPQDPLYSYARGDSKAMIEVAGKPMIQWVLDALGNAKNVDNVIVVGLSPKSEVTCKKPMYFLSNQGRMLANIVTGVNKVLELNRKARYVLIVSSDIPTVKSEHVDWLIENAMQTQDDIYYGVCPQEVMEARFPGSKRTYTHLKDMDVCGADMNITHVRMATEHLDMWEELIGNRKSPTRQAAAIGLWTGFLLITRQLALADAVTRVTKRLGIAGRAIIWEHAEPCMDIDKPHQLELLRADLQSQVRKARAGVGSAARKSAAKKKSSAKKTVAAKKAPAKTAKNRPETKPKKAAIRRRSK